jgi:hypothetical protein
MNKDTHEQTVLFPDLADRDVVVVADDPTTSSDGGALLLHAADRKLGLIDMLAKCITDPRQQGKVQHSIREMLRQRIVGIACGYEDTNDAARLKGDPVHAMISKGTTTGTLASQPTLCRLENLADTATNDLLQDTMLHRVTTRQGTRQRRRVKHVVIDFDGTVDPTHGQQEFSEFNGYYKTHCYQALLGFVRFDGGNEHHLVAATLHAGTGSLVAPALERLFWIVTFLRTYYRNARLCVRLDAGFAAPEMFAFFELHDLDYVVGMGANAVLTRLAEPSMIHARVLAKERGETSRVYTETMYQAGTWPSERRVVIKAEVVAHPDREHKDNARFVITNLRQSARHIYTKIYCRRGDVENRIKELKNDLSMDRTSCSDFQANRFRVLMTAAAYVLNQELRCAAHSTAFATAQVARLRLAFIKVAARVDATVRRITIHLPATFAFLREWRLIARRLGAVFE